METKATAINPTIVRKGEQLHISKMPSSLDINNARLIKEYFKQLPQEGAKSAKIDLSNVWFVDSSGIGSLLSLFKKFDQQLTLVNPTPTVLSVLELLRLNRVFPIEIDQ